MESIFKVESRRMFQRAGLGRPVFWRALLTHLLLVAVFGVFLPHWKGVEFMDPALPTIYACLGALFAAPAWVQVSKDADRRWPATFARVIAATIYGEVLTLVILSVAFATVLLEHRTAYLFLPDPILLGEAALLGLGLALALTAMAGCLTLQFSGTAATTVLRLLYLSLFVVFFFRSWWLINYLGRGALISFAAAALFFLALKQTSQPAAA